MHPLRFWFYVLALSAAATLLPGSIHAASTAGKPVVPAPVVSQPVVKASSMLQELRRGKSRVVPLPEGCPCCCKSQNGCKGHQ